MELRLDVGPDRLTVDDAIALEEGIDGMRAMRDFLARFVVNGDGQRADPKEGAKIVGALTMAQLAEAMGAVRQGFEGVQRDAVDPPSSEP